MEPEPHQHCINDGHFLFLRVRSAAQENIVPISVDQDEYFQALETALDLLTACSPTLPKPAGEQALSVVLAWAWDSCSSQPDALAGILCCDDRLRDLALKLIVGRCYHHRPIAHPRKDEIERFYYRHHGHPLAAST
jgi:hypothetical protein